MIKDTPHDMLKDAGKGFGSFVDNVLRGRNNKWILNSSAGVSALEIGVPSSVTHDFAGESFIENFPFDLSHMITNNQQLNKLGQGGWVDSAENNLHPLFEFSAENFTLFGLDFPNFFQQFKGGASEHITPLYPENVAEAIGLPDLPYGEMAHFAHLGLAVYDTGRTFQDVWKQIGDHYKEHNTSPEEQGIGLAAHLGKTITHPEMLHTLAARGTMLTVMGLLHPLGPVVAIGVAYLAAHLVHSFFGVLEHNKEAIQKIEDVPVLKAIYNHSGIKEWAEKDLVRADEASEAERVDPYQELELTPEREIRHARRHGRLAHVLEDLNLPKA